jgi:hypothetical protein
MFMVDEVCNTFLGGFLEMTIPRKIYGIKD